MTNHQVVTPSQIEAGLRSIGLDRGDAVEVHSSLRAFGWVEGGAATIVDALMRVIGPEGAMVMSAYRVSGDIPLTPEEQARGITWKVKVLPEDSPEPIGLGPSLPSFSAARVWCVVRAFIRSALGDTKRSAIDRAISICSTILDPMNCTRNRSRSGRLPQ